MTDAPPMLFRDGSTWLRFDDPREVWSTHAPDDVPTLLRAAQDAREHGAWIAGYLGYEAASGIHPALTTHTPDPQGPPILWLAAFAPPQRTESPFPDQLPAFTDPAWSPAWDRTTFTRQVDEIHRMIAAGHTYQLNLTFPYTAPWSPDPFPLFAHLQTRHPSPYAGYVHTDRHAILSASPELFVRQDANGLTMRPMKGTAPRHPCETRDAEIATRLAESEKDRAENIMIVDMVRNDLGRLARPGSVQVHDLCTPETYRTVHQLTSTVSAVAHPTLPDLFANLFPCASVTGAPKKRTMELIRHLEAGPRGPYCGSIGWAAPDGTACYNVAIRTLVLDRVARTARYDVGCGVVWDSTADAEYDECLTKARLLDFAPRDFETLETARLDRQGGLALAQRHLTRLERTARWFGFPFDRTAIEQALHDTSDRLLRDEPAIDHFRLRITLDGHGILRVTHTACSAPDSSPPWSVAIDTHPIDPEDPFLYHKTTRRKRYEEARERHPGADDVLLINPQGHLCESTIGNLVIQKDGRRITPPESCGLLRGTLRDEALDAGMLSEGLITPAELRQAEAAWIINSVRGWIPIHLATS